MKIRHYGLLDNRQKQTRLARARALLGVVPVPESKPLPELLHAQPPERWPAGCPFCQRPGLVCLGEVGPRPRARLDSS